MRPMRSLARTVSSARQAARNEVARVRASSMTTNCSPFAEEKSLLPTAARAAARAAARVEAAPERFGEGHCSSTHCTLGAGHAGLCSHLCVEGRRRE